MNFDIFEQEFTQDIPFNQLFQKVGKALQEMRVAKGITQIQLAKISNTSLRSIKNAESGKTISMTTFLKMLDSMQETEYLLDTLKNPHFEDLSQDLLFGTGRSSKKRYRKSHA